MSYLDKLNIAALKNDARFVMGAAKGIGMLIPDRNAEDRYIRAVYEQESRRHDRETLNKYNSMSSSQKEQWDKTGVTADFAPKWRKLKEVDAEVGAAKQALIAQAQANPTHTRIQNTVQRLDQITSAIRKQQNNDEAKGAKNWSWKDTMHHTFQPLRHTPLDVYGTGQDIYKAGKSSIDAAKGKKDFASGFAAGFNAVMGATDVTVRDTVPGMRNMEEIIDPAVESWANKGPKSARRMKKLLTMGYNPVQAFNTVLGTAFAAEDELRAALGMGEKDENFEEFLNEMGMAPIWREIDNPAIGPVKAFRAAMMAKLGKSLPGRSALPAARSKPNVDGRRYVVVDHPSGTRLSDSASLSMHFVLDTYHRKVDAITHAQTDAAMDRSHWEHAPEVSGEMFDNGRDMNVYVNNVTKEAIVVFRGNTTSKRDMYTVASVVGGYEGFNKRVKQNIEHTQQALEAYPDYKFTLSGHSLGGGEALYINEYFGKNRPDANIVAVHAFNPVVSVAGRAGRLFNLDFERIKENRPWMDRATTHIIKGDTLRTGQLIAEKIAESTGKTLDIATEDAATMYGLVESYEPGYEANGRNRHNSDQFLLKEDEWYSTSGIYGPERQAYTSLLRRWQEELRREHEDQLRAEGYVEVPDEIMQNVQEKYSPNAFAETSAGKLLYHPELFDKGKKVAGNTATGTTPNSETDNTDYEVIADIQSGGGPGNPDDRTQTGAGPDSGVDYTLTEEFTDDHAWHGAYSAMELLREYESGEAEGSPSVIDTLRSMLPGYHDKFGSKFDRAFEKLFGESYTQYAADKMDGASTTTASADAAHDTNCPFCAHETVLPQPLINSNHQPQMSRHLQPLGYFLYSGPLDLHGQRVVF